MKYKIEISEEQRVALLEALRLADQLRAPSPQDELLQGLLNILPARERSFTGLTHTFIPAG